MTKESDVTEEQMNFVINAQKKLKQEKQRKREIMNLEPGDNTKFVAKNRELFNLPRVDLSDKDAVLSRIDTFFDIIMRYDSKPTVTGFAMAMGLNRRRLWELKTGKFQARNAYEKDMTDEVKEIIIKTYDYLEIMWEDYMLNGKVNPVSGIFLGKNNFGYQDQTEYVVTPKTQKEEYDPESIRKRYLTDAENSETDEN